MSPVRVYLQVFVALNPETGLPIDPETGEEVRFGKLYIDCFTYTDTCLEPEGGFGSGKLFPRRCLHMSTSSSVRIGC